MLLRNLWWAIVDVLSVLQPFVYGYLSSKGWWCAWSGGHQTIAFVQVVSLSVFQWHLSFHLLFGLASSSSKASWHEAGEHSSRSFVSWDLLFRFIIFHVRPVGGSQCVSITLDWRVKCLWLVESFNPKLVVSSLPFS